MEHVEATPPERLSPLVARYSGYRYEGTPPGTHLGLPSPYLTVVISLGKPSGFYDQAHLTREWNDLVGRTPTAWLAAEELPFVQDGGD